MRNFSIDHVLVDKACHVAKLASVKNIIFLFIFLSVCWDWAIWIRVTHN